MFAFTPVGVFMSELAWSGGSVSQVEFKPGTEAVCRGGSSEVFDHALGDAKPWS